MNADAIDLVTAFVVEPREKLGLKTSSRSFNYIHAGWYLSSSKSLAVSFIR